MTKQKTLGILLVVSALAVGTGASFTEQAFAEVRTIYFASGDIRQGINSDTTDDKSKIGYYNISGLEGMRNSIHVTMDFYPAANTSYEVRLINTSNGDEFVLGELKQDDKRDVFSVSEDVSGYDVIKVFEISDKRNGHAVSAGQSTIVYLDDLQSPTRPN